MSPDDLTCRFFTAAGLGDIGTLRELLAEGVDPAVVVHGITPLEAAISYSRNEVFDLLMRDRDVVASVNREKDGFGPLALAARAGNRYMAARLIEAGADLNHAYCFKSSPLGAAICAGKPEMVEFLIGAGADASSMPGWMWRYYLGTYAQAGSVDGIVRTLVEAGADVNVRDTNGGTLAHLAVGFFRDPEWLLDLFVTAGGDLGLKDSYGRTAYDQALQMFNSGAQEKIARLLAAEGRDVPSPAAAERGRECA